MIVHSRDELSGLHIDLARTGLRFLLEAVMPRLVHDLAAARA